MVHVYNFYPKQQHLILPFIHWSQQLPSKVQLDPQEQPGVQFLVQGHYDMWTRERGSNRQPQLWA